MDFTIETCIERIKMMPNAIFRQFLKLNKILPHGVLLIRGLQVTHVLSDTGCFYCPQNLTQNGRLNWIPFSSIFECPLKK